MTRLVVLSGGSAAQVRALHAQVAKSLAGSPDLDWRDQWQHLTAADAPHQVLQQLMAQEAESTLGFIGLPLDPGLPLVGGGHWAEALGAWRQPVVVVLSVEQLDTGLPAAMTALLQQWQVPLVGLLQWGDPWDGPTRRRDGLPWLGASAPGANAWDSSLRQSLALALRSRLA